MAPPAGAGKRVKGVQIFRPFIYGTTARPFDDATNPKPKGIPDDHTHSWTVFVKGIDDVDITYWLRRVQFKLHETIPNHIRMIEGEKDKPFELNETGWGEFEITVRLYYASESGEKPQTLYHHLRLHPYGRTPEEREAMRLADGGTVRSWSYEEQIFNEPYEAFYDVLTSGALPPPRDRSGSVAGKNAGAPAEEPRRTEGGVLERSAMVPLTSRPDVPFSKEMEGLEMTKLKAALVQVEENQRKLVDEVHAKEQYLRDLRAETGRP